VELHKPQARKRTALISNARVGRTGAFYEDARWRDFLSRKDNDMLKLDRPRCLRAGQVKSNGKT
jgi:hypothetical protein